MAIRRADTGFVASLGFDPAVGELLRGQTNKPFQPFGPAGGPPVGVAVAVTDGKAAEGQIKLLQPQLLSLGYRAFWTALHEDNGMRICDAVAVLHATDSFAVIDAALPDGGNYGITTDDIRGKLKSWAATCRFEIVGASRDWVALVFQTLPNDLCTFVEDVYLFCSDVFESDTGKKAREDAANREAQARARCPDLSASFWRAHECKFKEVVKNVDDTPFAPLIGEPSSFYDLIRSETLRNVQLFAHRLAETKYLYLWWD